MEAPDPHMHNSAHTPELVMDYAIERERAAEREQQRQRALQALGIVDQRFAATAPAGPTSPLPPFTYAPTPAPRTSIPASTGAVSKTTSPPRTAKSDPSLMGLDLDEAPLPYNAPQYKI